MSWFGNLLGNSKKTKEEIDAEHKSCVEKCNATKESDMKKLSEKSETPVSDKKEEDENKTEEDNKPVTGGGKKNKRKSKKNKRKLFARKKSRIYRKK